MFQIKNNRIVLNKTRTLSPKQVSMLSRLTTEYDRNRYLLSIMGLVRGAHRIHRVKSFGHDQLETKPKNTILNSFKRLQDLDNEYVPSEKDLGQWVGVEIECLIPNQDGHQECQCEYDADGDLDYECTWCSQGQPSHWSEEDAHGRLKDMLNEAGVTRVSVKADGSVKDDSGQGVECTILFNTKHGYEPLHKLCKTLINAGCYVNKSCGLHVHLDVRHLTELKVLKIGKSLGHSLPVLKWLVPESRHNNDFCKLKVSRLVRSDRGNNNWYERYSAINLTSFYRFKTIEVRLHSGSINASKIQSWINLLKVVGDAKLTKDLDTFQDLIDLGLNETMIAYAESRVNELNPQAWTVLINGPEPVPVVTEVKAGA